MLSTTNTFLHVVLQRSRRDVSFAETLETVSVSEEENINEDEVSQKTVRSRR